jgi:hypothetical protein
MQNITPEGVTLNFTPEGVTLNFTPEGVTLNFNHGRDIVGFSELSFTQALTISL